ncbi:MAG: rhodanese-like domain-containing protein [Nitrospirales bacterium]
MTPDQLLADIKQGTAPVIVDVRTLGEYESGHVPGAQHLPFYAMWSHHDEITAKANDPIVVYCEHGPRAWIGKFALWTVGFKNIDYLDGNMSGWKQKGLPIEHHSGKAHE